VFAELPHLDPYDAPTYRTFGNALADLGLHEEAAAQYQKAITLDPTAKTHYDLGDTLLDIGHYESAIRQYKKALEFQQLDPVYVSAAFANWAYCAGALGRYNEAVTISQQALELEPNNACRHVNVGYWLLVSKDVAKAIPYLQKAIALDPEGYTAPINLGIAYSLLDSRKDATLHFTSGLEKCPASDPHSCFNKITALLGLGHIKDALNLLPQIFQWYPITPSFAKIFVTDWNLLTAAPNPPSGIDEFLEEANALISVQEQRESGGNDPSDGFLHQQYVSIHQPDIPPRQKYSDWILAY
jgi:tetratricopeptide (TPR) repeat protein